MKLNKIIFPFSLTSTFFFGVYAAVCFFDQKINLSIFYFFVSLYSIISYYFYYKTKDERIIKVAVGLLSLPILIPAQIFGGVFGSDIFLLYIYTTWSFFILGKRLGLYCSLFAIFVSLCIFILQLSGYIDYFYNIKIILFFYLTYLIQVLISYFYQYSKEKIEKELEDNNKILSNQKDELENRMTDKQKSEQQLKEYTDDLEDIKKATLNILEDLNLEKNEIEKSKANVDAILSSIADGLVAIDTNGNILFVNDSANNLLGYDSNDLAGKKWGESVLIKDISNKPIEDDQKPFSISISKNEKVSGRYSYSTKNGKTIPVSVTVSPIMINNQTIGVIEVFRDITKEIEIDKAKNEFISIASHELRTPMTAIKGYVSMLLDGDYGKLPEKVTQPLQDVASSTQRLISLVNDLLNISRIEAGRLKVDIDATDIKLLVEETVNGLMPLAKQNNIALVSKVDSKKVSVDKSVVLQILNNLIGNALKFTEKGSITVTSEISGEYLKLFIKDTGIGISKDDQIKLFGKFNQIEDSVRGHIQGTGLGLYISKSAANKMGGDVWLESSEVNKGTTFGFSMPIADTTLANNIKSEIEKSNLANTDLKKLS